MTVKTMDPIGVPVSTFPPPRFRTRRFTFCARNSSARGEHVRGGAAEPIEGRDDQGIAFMQCVEGFVELRPPRMSATYPVVNVKIIATDAGSE
jgi:hypothetical protein